METLEYDHTIFQDGMEQECDKALMVKFLTKPWRDKTESEKQGRPIFREREYIEIMVPGDRTNVICRPSRPADRARFPRHYDAFKRRKEMPTEGTLLSEWPAISASQVEELSYHNVKTVEQLVDMPFNITQNFLGIQSLIEKGRRFLEQSAKGATLDALQTELNKRDQIIADMERKLTAMEQTLQKTSDDNACADADSETQSVTPRRSRKKTLRTGPSQGVDNVADKDRNS